MTGAWIDPALGRMTFREWVERWEPSTVDLRPTTYALNIEMIRNYLLPRFGSWPLAGIRTADVKTMVATENAGELSNSAVRRDAIVLGRSSRLLASTAGPLAIPCEASNSPRKTRAPCASSSPKRWRR